jgi:hypothetical protein
MLETRLDTHQPFYLFVDFELLAHTLRAFGCQWPVLRICCMVEIRVGEDELALIGCFPWFVLLRKPGMDGCGLCTLIHPEVQYTFTYRSQSLHMHFSHLPTFQTKLICAALFLYDATRPTLLLYF